MAWLSRLFKGSPYAQGPGLRVDELCGDPQAHEWAARLARGEWTGLSAFLQLQENVETRDLYVRVLADQLKGWPSWLDEWVESAPDDAMARLFRAARYIRHAWDERGRGRAHSVKSESWPLFFSRLEAADADLSAAADLVPEDPGPWVLMITTARGRQLQLDEERRRFAEVERRYPFHARACQQMVQATAAKWGGSNELMLEFARSISARAPEGSPAHAVIPDALCEYWGEVHEDEKDFWHRPEVRAEILEAAQRCFTNPQQTPYMVRARNSFAFAYLLLGEFALLAEQFDVTGGVITDPWSAMDNAVSQVAKFCAVGRRASAAGR